VRYRDPRVAINFYPTIESGDSAVPPTIRSARITFTQPQRALASGQIMALYRGEQLLGGGVFA
jgi:tRNA-specific 2-thiouridylase